MGVPLSNLALAWCLRRPEITSTIVGATSVAQIEQNAAASDLRLDEEVLTDIRAVYRSQPMPY